MNKLIALSVVLAVWTNIIKHCEASELELQQSATHHSVVSDTSDLTRMYDLHTDPYQSLDVINSTEYESQLAYFESRQAYWKSLTVTKNLPDNSNQTAAWNACGRVCAWIEDDYEPIKIEQRYNYSDAPHIVYILVDDWGYNDAGLHSTFMNWTTPTFDKLASEGILLANYFTNELCAPSRASLLTGRYNLRLGVFDNNCQLPLSETTIAQELQSAGYRTYIVGKWHQGLSSEAYWPRQRGFDGFYGYYNGFESYWGKEYNDYIDLFTDNDFVTDESELDKSLHSGYLYTTKAEHMVQQHAENYPDTPMFLYYAMQLVHDPWTAPEIYLERCMSDPSEAYVSDDESDVPNGNQNVVYNYCAMNVMMDEAIANLTCTLEKYGFADNTILIIAGDNGGEKTITGNSLPFKGHKNNTMRGGISNTAIVHSKLIPPSSQGSVYYYNVHITDWLPTILMRATGGAWNGSYTGATIDGVDIWDAIVDNTPSSHDEMVVLSYPSGPFAMIYSNVSYYYDLSSADADYPTTYFDEDLDPSASRMLCDNPSLVDYE